jgi:DNA-binding transcriptional MerR regulator
MATDHTMTIRDLSEASGVSVRRIRYYVQKRLIPGPRGKTRSARYSLEHVTAIRQQQDLRQTAVLAQPSQELDLGRPQRTLQVDLAPDVSLVLRLDVAGRRSAAERRALIARVAAVL